MEKLGWGIIGCGDVTEVKSGPAFNKADNSKLVAVMRRDAAKAADYASRHNVSKWYDDASKLINDPDVNAIYIATPPSSHFKYAFDAIEAGKPVYIEKPMTLYEREAFELDEYATKKNIKISVAHYRRGQPKFIKIKSLLEEGAIGKPRYCRLNFTRPPLSPEALQLEKTAWRVDPAVSGGGFFHDLAPHQLDLMLYFFGEMKTACGLSGNQAGLYKADDVVSGSIMFRSGVVFNGFWNFASMPGANADECEIVGSEGSISFAVFDHTSFTLTNAAGIKVFPYEPLQHVQEPMIKKVVDYFLGKGPNPCSQLDGFWVMHLMQLFTKQVMPGHTL